MVDLEKVFALSLELIGGSERNFLPYKSVFFKPFLATDNFQINEELQKNVQEIGSYAYVISRGRSSGSEDYICIKDSEFLCLLGLYREKKSIRNQNWLHDYFEGIIPLQFSKNNMYQTLSKNRNDLILWEYRSGKSKVQAYFKDDTNDELYIKKRLEQDIEMGLKPYFASYKLRNRSKGKSTFSIHGEGIITSESEYFRDIRSEIAEVGKELLERELKFIDFVREIKLEKKYENIPFTSTFAKLNLNKNFESKLFGSKTKDDFQTALSKVDSKALEGTIYQQGSGEYVTLTVFPRTVYVFPKTQNRYRQEGLVANITYALDDLFGLSKT